MGFKKGRRKHDTNDKKIKNSLTQDWGPPPCPDGVALLAFSCKYLICFDFLCSRQKLEQGANAIAGVKMEHESKSPAVIRPGYKLS
jgi:hypothetical protein